MPSGHRHIRLGDKCLSCDCELIERIAIYKGDGHYLQTRCKYCFYKHRDSVPSRSKRARAKQYIEWKWNISILKYSEMVSKQLGGCAICKKECDVRSRLAVDHNHKTGEIRDLLCHRCNTALGMLEENEDLIWDMLEYIKRHSKKVAA